MKRAGPPRSAPEEAASPAFSPPAGAQGDSAAPGRSPFRPATQPAPSPPPPHQTTVVAEWGAASPLSPPPLGEASFRAAAINYSKGALQYAGAQYPPPPKPPPPQQQRQQQASAAAVAVTSAVTSAVPVAVAPLGSTFQRLKVEDALSYLDQVKYKFNNQPQVYNDFLDIMKEFKSQSIDTPGVIGRVSHLFKGHPELIVGFNTFLPPGYKIEVQANDQGYAYQVSVSMPSPNSVSLQHQQQAHNNNVAHAGTVLSSAGGILVGPPQTVQPSSQPHLVHVLPGTVTGAAVAHNLSTGAGGAAAALSAAAASSSAVPTNTLHHISQAHQQLEAPAPPPPNSSSQPVEFNHAIEYVNKIKNRFNRQPEKYKKFLEILHAYQRGQKEVKEPQIKQQTEQEVYAQVAKLFENQDDLLMEFGQFLPDATGGGGIGGVAMKATAALDAARNPDPSRPRPSAHQPQRTVESVAIESESQIYHSSVGIGRAPSPGYAAVKAAPPPAVQQPVAAHRTERDHAPSSQAPVAQASSHHLSKHSTSSHHVSSSPSSSSHHLKRSPSFGSSAGQTAAGAPPPKKHKSLTPRDVSFAEAAKFGTQTDFSFFDKVRNVLKNNEVYDNFLRCLLLFNSEVVSKSELLAVTATFFSRHPELQRWLQEFLGLAAGTASGSPSQPSAASSPPPIAVPVHNAYNNASAREPLSTHPPHPYSLLTAQGYGASLYSSGGERYTGENNTLSLSGAQLRQDRPQGDAAMEIDLTTCRRLGTSYCALPRGSADSPSRRCSGRTPLCKDVLNETWVSFPTWAEDSTFVTNRKTQFEEYIYRCEDERFELDVVIETNASTILALEGVHKKLCRLNPEEATRFRLDDCLGGTSPTVHQRALKRIYGEKANDIIAGLKKNPLIAVPIVLRRLKTKEEEWREAQKGFNKQWRELNEKYYLKSLDYQGVNFKQNDLKALRSKSLFNEIEAIYEERKEAIQATAGLPRGRSPPRVDSAGPHLVAQCGPGGASLLADAADLLIHHVRRQTAIQKQEKQKVKQLLRHFLPDLFQHPRHPLSDDERDDDDKELDVAMDSPVSDNETKAGSGLFDGDGESKSASSNRLVKQEKDLSSESDTNTSSADKVSNAKGASRQSKEDKTSRENKENLKCSNSARSNSADASDAKDSIHSSKAGDACAPKTPSRKREGSNESSTRIKTEPVDSSPTADVVGVPSRAEPSDVKDKNAQPIVFFGSGHWYVFLRLHAVLCQRLAEMKALAARLAKEEVGDSRLRRPGVAVALKLKPDNALPVSQYYSALLEMIRSVLDGNTEASAYEDNLRDMFGVNAYVAFTLDKVVSYAVRQLQQCVQERAASRCVELHLQEKARTGASSVAAYQRRAQKLLREDHAFKICVFGGEDCRVSFELLESGAGVVSGGSGNSNGSENGIAEPPLAPQSAEESDLPLAPPTPPARLGEWARYRERYVNPSVMDAELPEGIYKDGVWRGRKAVYLQRNVRLYRKRCVNNGSPSVRPHSSDDDVDDEDDDDEYGTTIASKRKRPNTPDPSSAAADAYVNRDGTEGLFDDEADCKFAYVVKKEHFLCKKSALKRAWKSHKAVSRRQEGKWRAWLVDWCGRNVSSADSRTASEWLRRGARVLSAGGPDAPPYGPYARYRLAPAPPPDPDR